MARGEKDPLLEAPVLCNGWPIFEVNSFCIMDSLTSEVELHLINLNDVDSLIKIFSSELCFSLTGILNSCLPLVFKSCSVTAPIPALPQTSGCGWSHQRFWRSDSSGLFRHEASQTVLHRPPAVCLNTAAVTILSIVLVFILVWMVNVYLEILGPPSWPARNCLCKSCCLSPQMFPLPCPWPAPQLQWVQYQRKHCQ